MIRFIKRIILGGVMVSGAVAQADAKTVYDFTPKNIMGEASPLSAYRGKVLLIVNTASKCGFTGQYEGLEALYEKYKDQGFVVLGFPSNDFLSQEPGSNKEILDFCKTKYHVSFPMFEKNPVTGEEKQPLFKWLTEEQGDELNGGVKWNFEKFIIGRDGHLKDRFGSFSTPSGTRVTEAIEKALAEEAPAS